MAKISKNNGMIFSKAKMLWQWIYRIGAAVLEGAVGLFFVLVMIFIIFNPLFFIPLCLLAPQRAAKLLGVEMVLTDIMKVLYTPFIALLPFRWKKHFMVVYGLSSYSNKMQCRYFASVKSQKKRTELLKREMSLEAISFLWAQSEHDVREEIILADVVLNDKQFKMLVDKEETLLIRRYLSKRTPSEAMLQMLLSARMAEPFLFCVEQYGLSARLIGEVFALEKLSGSDMESERSKMFRQQIVGLTQQALNRYAQRQMVRQAHSQEEWQLFLQQQDSLCLAAQKMMNVWQYNVYHAAGFHLSAEAIVWFLSKGDASMWRCILKYEPQSAFNGEAQALINANPQLMSLALSNS